MPTIRVDTNKLTRVSQRGQAANFQSSQTPAGAFGVTGGGGGGNDFLGGALADIDKIILDAAKADAEKSAKDADNRIAQTIRETLYGQQGDDIPGFLKTGGEDSVQTAGAAEQTLREAIARELEGSSGYKRKLIEQAGSTRLNGALDRVYTHAGEQRKVAAELTSVAREGQAISTAVVAYGDDGAVAQAAGVITAEAKERADNKGLGAEATEQLVAGRIGVLAETLVDAALANNDVRRAQDVLEYFGGQMDGATLAKATQKLAKDELVLFAQEAVDGIQARYGLGGEGEAAIRRLLEGREEAAALKDFTERASRQFARNREGRSAYNHRRARAKDAAADAAPSIVDDILEQNEGDYRASAAAVAEIEDSTERRAAEATLKARFGFDEALNRAERSNRTQEKDAYEDEAYEVVDNLLAKNGDDLAAAAKSISKIKNPLARAAAQKNLDDRFSRRVRQDQAERVREQRVRDGQKRAAVAVVDRLIRENDGNVKRATAAAAKIEDPDARLFAEKEIKRRFASETAMERARQLERAKEATEEGTVKADELLAKHKGDYGLALDEANNIRGTKERQAVRQELSIQREINNARDRDDKRDEIETALTEGRKLADAYFLRDDVNDPLNSEATARQYFDANSANDRTADVAFARWKELITDEHNDEKTSKRIREEARKEFDRRRALKKIADKEQLEAAEVKFSGEYVANTPTTERSWASFKQLSPVEASVIEAGGKRAYWQEYLRRSITGDTSADGTDNKTLKGLLQLDPNILMNVNTAAYDLRLTSTEQNRLRRAKAAAAKSVEEGPSSAIYNFAEGRIRRELEDSSLPDRRQDDNINEANNDMRVYIADVFDATGKAPTPAQVTRKILELKTRITYIEGGVYDSEETIIRARMEALSAAEQDTITVQKDHIPSWLRTKMQQNLPKGYDVSDMPDEILEPYAAAILLKQSKRATELAKQFASIKKLQGN